MERKKMFSCVLFREKFVPLHQHPPYAVAVDFVKDMVR